MTTPNNKEQYEKDVAYALEHPQKGIRCQKCPTTYFHPLLGCPTCGKYKDVLVATKANNE